MLFQRVDEGAILLNVEEEVYFGLNAVGAEIWQLLPPKCTSMSDLLGEMTRLYPEVDPAAIEADVNELLGTLITEGLVVHTAAR